MAVPLEIRSVKRPVNTVVIDTGGNSIYRYPVRERSRSVYVAGGNPSPRNGKVIGHIIDGQFVPVKQKSSYQGPDMLSYGGAALVKAVSSDLLSELLQVYPAKEAYTMMSIAALRVIKPGIAGNRYGTHYQRTFVSKYYPGAALSKNSIKDLMERIGMDGGRRREFYQKRLTQVSKDHHIAIDGTLKEDNSTENDLSAFSRKARVKGCKEISILYAYDIEQMEPLCCEVFPGNSIDASSYQAFIRDNNITHGIIIDDKGFPPSKIEEELKLRPNLHFLTPIKRNDKRITNNDMLTFEGVLTGIDKHVLYRKKQIKGGRFLYAFKEITLAGAEEHAFVEKARSGKPFDLKKYAKKKDTFGVIVFESDMDMDPRTAYLCYDDRWLLELVFRAYKNDECLDETRVQNDFTVIGSEFINFLSTVITCRIIRKSVQLDLLKDMSYRELMEDLNSAWRTTDAPEPARTDDGCWVHTLEMVFEELEKLELSIPVSKPEPKKKGRPAKPKEDKPKRPRGRPRKNPIS